MSEETLDPIIKADTPSPDEVKASEEVKEQAEANPDVDIDAGEEEETIDDVAKTGNWYDNLPADYRNDPDVTKYKSLDAYVKGNREVRKLVGKDKLILPTKNSSPAEVQAFYEKLGRPKQAEEYALPELDKAELPEGIGLQDDTTNAFKQKAFELGITADQFKALYGFQHELTVARYKQEKEKVDNMRAETEKELRGEYGAAYEAKVDGAQKVINTFFKGQKLHPAFETLSNDKGFVRAMASIADHMGEDVITNDKRATLTPDEAQKEYDSLLAGTHSLSKALFNDLDPEHKVAVDKSISLATMMSGGK